MNDYATPNVYLAAYLYFREPSLFLTVHTDQADGRPKTFWHFDPAARGYVTEFKDRDNPVSLYLDALREMRKYLTKKPL